MLIFNPNRVFKLRGIEKPQTLLVKNGFSATTASKLMNNQKKWVSIKHLETLCKLLNCTPDDLFEWKSDRAGNLSENHQLNTLRRSDATRSLKEMFKDLPLDKVEQLVDEQES